MATTTASILEDWFYSAGRAGNYATMHIWDGDGNAARVFEFNFEGGYLNTAHVKAFMVNTKTRDKVDLTVAFTGVNTVTLSQAVPTGWQVTVYRDTPKATPLASYVDGAVLNALNLDRNSKQAMFAVSEMVDRFDVVTSTSEEALKVAYSTIDKADNAVTVANAANTKADNSVTVANSANSKADSAVSTANSANATATGIDGKAQTALDNSKDAVSTANAAKSTADGIDAKANTALDNSQDAVAVANTANMTAEDAKATANGIDDKATEALNNSQEAFQQSAATAIEVNYRLYSCDTLQGLSSLPTSTLKADFPVYVAQPQVGGIFKYREGTPPVNDVYGIVYVSVPTGGYFVRDTQGYINVLWAGCDSSKDADFNTPRMQACIDVGKALGYSEVRFPKGVWNTHTLRLEHTADTAEGQLERTGIPPSLVGMGAGSTWLRCFTDEEDSNVGVVHGYMQNPSEHVHSSLRIKNMTIDGTTNRPAISFAGLIRAEVHNVTFEKCTAGILYHNRDGDNFTEYCVAVGCEFSWGCHTALEYKVSNGVDSFHGSGMRDCVVNNYQAYSTVIIGEGAFVYNAPLSFQVWKYNLTPLILCNSAVGGLNFHGTITSETFGSIGPWKMCHSPAGSVSLVGSTSQLWGDMELGDLVLAERNVTEWVGNTGARYSYLVRKPVSAVMEVPAGRNWQVADINLHNPDDVDYPFGAANITVHFESNDKAYMYIGMWFVVWGRGKTRAQLVASPWATWGNKNAPEVAITPSGDLQVILPDNEGYMAQANVNFIGFDSPVFTK